MTYDWQTTYAQAITTFGGDTPGAALEQHVLDQFRQHPQAVTNAIRKIGEAYEAGRIRSPWGALKAEIAKQVDADIVVPAGSDRKQAVLRADQWMRNAGMHIDRWHECEDELFGDRGMLRPHDSPQLRDRMRNAWNTVRPIGEAIELEAEERAAKWVADRQQHPTVTAEPKPEPVCSRCGQTQGHKPDCPLVLKYAQPAAQEAPA